MALPAGRYGVTKNQLLKIKKLPMNTIKLIEELTEKFNLLGSAAFKNSTSVVTDSTDLVESGAVKELVGWGNKNLFNPEYFKQMPTIYSVNGDTVTASSSDALTWANIAVYPLKKGTYKLLRTNTQGTSSFRLSDDEYATTTTIDANVDEITFTLNSDGGIKIKGFTLSNWTFPASGKFMISVNGGTYEPYHASVEESLEQKCDNSVIGTVEGANASKAWSVGEHFIKDGAFKEVTQPIASGGAISDSNTVDKPIADCLIKKGTFSGTTNTNGAMTVNGTTGKRILFACSPNNYYLCLPYLRGADNNMGLKIFNPATFEPIASTAVSGIYYYINE